MVFVWHDYCFASEDLTGMWYTCIIYSGINHCKFHHNFCKFVSCYFLDSYNGNKYSWLEYFPEKPSWCRNEQVCQGGQKV